MPAAKLYNIHQFPIKKPTFCCGKRNAFSLAEMNPQTMTNGVLRLQLNYRNLYED
tara:strand:- start:603 stop:767 length:165 start_codon:yes stop_codon:yes gene_type:complete